LLVAHIPYFIIATMVEEKVNKDSHYIYLNILKTLAIIMVCSYHFTLVYANYSSQLSDSVAINRFIINACSACIPLFMMVNGALMLNKNYSNKTVLRKTLFIFIQFEFWRLITLLIIGTYLHIDLVGRIKEIVSYMVTGSFEGIAVNHFWFIPCLIAIYLLYPMIKSQFDNYRLNKDKYIIYFLAVLSIPAFAPSALETLQRGVSMISKVPFYTIRDYMPFTSNIGFMAFYFILGGILHHHLGKIQKVSILKLLLFYFFGLVLLFWKWAIESIGRGAQFDSILGGYITYAGIFLTVPLFIAFSRINANSFKNNKHIIKFFHILGTNTLNVYYIHWIVGFVALKYITVAIPHASLLTNFIKALILAVTISYFSHYMKKLIKLITKRYAPSVKVARLALNRFMRRWLKNLKLGALIHLN
jgi:surface polysaccharide O-acyltransferase-like enzyme